MGLELTSTLGRAEGAQGWDGTPCSTQHCSSQGTFIFRLLTVTKTYLDCFQSDSQLNSCSSGGRVIWTHPKQGKINRNDTTKAPAGPDPRPRADVSSPCWCWCLHSSGDGSVRWPGRWGWCCCWSTAMATAVTGHHVAAPGGPSLTAHRPCAPAQPAQLSPSDIHP